MQESKRGVQVGDPRVCMHAPAHACIGTAMQFPGCKTCRVARAPPWQGRGAEKCFLDPPFPCSAGAPRNPPNAPRSRRQSEPDLRFPAAPPRGSRARFASCRRRRRAPFWPPSRWRGVSSSASAPSAGRRRAAPVGELLGPPTEGRRRGGGRQSP